MIQPRDQRIQFLMKGLIAMAFLAKISLGSVMPFLPHSLSFFIYQQGMHPYINVALCALLGGPLFLMSFRVEQKHSLSPIYKVFVFLLLTILVVQTCLQIFYVDPEESAIMQLGAVGVACFMVIVYGLVIPSIMNVHEFLVFVQKWTGIFVVVSLILLPVAGGVFKGGRFIGIFKHIPHMVTCATVAFVFSLGTLLNAKGLFQRVWNVAVILASFLAILLTGTRSSAGAAVLAVILTMALHKTKTNSGRILKFSFVTFSLLYSIFFGYQTLEFAHDVATGQQSLGSRGAQDGVAERWEEVERGTQIFLEDPWLGHGLLSKFSSGNEVDVSNYNSMKDPHNIFISAGVVGGWPLLVMSALSLLLMTIGCLKGLLSPDIYQRQVCIYLICHIPILVIYHIHLSIGGMADRVYWLVFGFVAASLVRSPSSQESNKVVSTP